MRPADIRTIHAEALRTLVAIDPRQLYLIVADQRNGYPSGGYDEGGGGGTSEHTPTERAALAPDSAQRALVELDRVMRQLRAATASLTHLNTMFTAQPRRAMCQNCGDPTGDRWRTHCRWCTTWLNDTGCLPGMKEISQRQAGGKPRRPKVA